MCYYNKHYINGENVNYDIEKNLLKTIIFTFIIIMSSLVVAISYFYIVNTQNNFDLRMKKYESDYYEDIKLNLKTKINLIIDLLDNGIIKSNLSHKDLQDYAVDFLSNISFEHNRSNYIFVYEIHNFDGGDNFAKMIVNPNRPDLLGKFVSTNYKDQDGKKFREEFLQNIKKTGESYTKYSYKNPNTNSLSYKLSYFKYYEKFNWIIAVGVYIDEVEAELLQKQEEHKTLIKEQIIQNVILFFMFLIIAIFISILLSNKIYKILKNYKIKVQENESDLKILNKSLEDVITNTAHQWRQPLSELSSILMLIKLKYQNKTLDDEFIDRKLSKATKVLEYMSNTIDDFRGLTSTKKEKESFNLNSEINQIVSTFSSTLQQNDKISIDLNINKEIFLNSYLNEYKQVVLNILKNARDILIERKIVNPQIMIEAIEDKNSVSLIIKDNAGGIKVEPINRVFEAYFTTKEKSKGTGIGLYMSKIIIQKSIKGKIFVENTNFGAKFTVVVFK